MRKFIIVSSSVIFRNGFKSMITAIKGSDIIGEGQSVEDIVCSNLPGEIYYWAIDLDDYGVCAADQVELIKRRSQHAKIMGFSKFKDDITLIKLFKTRINALMDKNCDLSDLNFAIKQMDAGHEHFMNPASEIIINYLLNTNPDMREKIKSQGFSSKEIEIIKLCCQQNTAKRIGEMIYVCEKTVDYHRNKIMSKMNVKNIVGMVIYAIKHNLVRLEEI